VDVVVDAVSLGVAFVVSDPELSVGVADATPWPVATAAPMPKATASAPTRPT
jgi:hypothetical protein